MSRPDSGAHSHGGSSSFAAPQQRSSSPGSASEGAALRDAVRAAAEVMGVPGGPSILSHARSESPRGQEEESRSSSSVEDQEPAAPSPEPAARLMEDGCLCVICLHECLSVDPIWSCATCSLTVHLRCMQSWVREQDAARRHARCPGCQQPVGEMAADLAYTCWCRRFNWTEMAGVEGVVPSHSCGQACGKSRPHGCSHKCTAVCHQDRCAPCTEMRIGVVCVGGHQTFAPFPCGTELPTCHEVCGAALPCGHTCAGPCHAGAHAPCRVPVAKFCSCDAASQVTVACEQQVVQCMAVCQKMLACGSHRCGRRCHIGACAEQMVVSAWNKNAWVKVGAPVPAPAVAAASPWSRFPGPAAAAMSVSADFPSLSAAKPAPVPASSAANSSSSSSSSSSSFPSCGKPCGRVRKCGHPCTLTCHAGTIDQEESAATQAGSEAAEKKEEDERQLSILESSAAVGASASASSIAGASTAAAPSLRAFSSCEATRCLQLVGLACPCARKSAKVKCFEAHLPPTVSRFQCDDTCRMYEHGRLFFRQLQQVEESARYGFKHLLPFSTAMLASLTSAASLDGGFLRKLEASVQKFVLSLCAAAQEGAKSSAASSAPSPHLYLSSLTAPRRQMVTQIALWYNLHFHDAGGYLERMPSDGVGPQQSQAKAARSERGKEEELAPDGVDGDLLPTSLLFPSVSLVSAAALFASAGSTALACCTAETWPAELVVRLTFADEDTGSVEMARAPSLRRWFGSYARHCRIILSTSRQVLVLFASPVLARQCYIRVRTHHIGELEGANVLLEAPAPTQDAQEEIDEDALQLADLKRQDSETRRQKQEEFDELRRREAKQRASQHIPSQSALKAVLSKPSVKVIRSEMVGLKKTIIQSRNAFDLLDDE